MNARKGWILALALLAAVLACTHLRMPRNVQGWRLDSSAAGLRSGERMRVDWPDGEINPNRATAAELDRLRSVGPALARRIVEERETNGPFYYPEDLINVKGIGEKTLKKMRKQLKLP